MAVITAMDLTHEPMRTYKIIFWITTGLFSAFMLLSAYSYLTAEEMKGAFTSLGFSEDFFRIELAIAKLLGALVLILPFIPKSLKLFAYAGFTINIVSALIAHIAMGYNSYSLLVFSIVALTLSYYTFNKLQKPI
ncbi:hypothetical protein D3C87_17980 [compost metagenome]